MDPILFGKRIKEQYPQYADIDEATLGSKYLERYGGAIQSIKSGQLKVTDIPEKQRVGVGVGLTALSESGETIEGTMTEEEKKKTKAKSEAERIIAQLEDAYFGGAGGKGLGYGKAGGAQKNLELATSLGEEIPPELEDLSTYKALRESVRPTFARAAGDSGNFSLPEQKAAVKNIPTEFQTLGQAKKYFASIRGKFGLPERDYTQTGQTPIPESLSRGDQRFLAPQPSTVEPPMRTSQQLPQRELNPLEKLLMPVAQGPIGTGAEALLTLLTPAYKKAVQKSARGEQVSLGEGIEAGGDVAATALPFLRIGKLGLAAKGALTGGVRGGTRNIPIEQRPLEAGKEAAVGGLLGNILAPGTLPKTLRSLGISKAQAQGVQIDLKPAVQAGKAFVKNTPLAEGPATKILSSLSKQKSVDLEQAFKKLSDWGPLTYTKGGDPKATATGQLYNILYGQIRKQIADKAPLASAGQSGLATLHKVGRGAGKVIGGGLFGGGAAIAGSAVLQKLFPQLFER